MDGHTENMHNIALLATPETVASTVHERRESKGMSQTSELSERYRDQAVSIFTYLVELSRLRSKNIRDIDHGDFEADAERCEYVMPRKDKRCSLFKVNGKKVDVPSFEVKKEDVISVRPVSLERTLFKNILLGLKKYEAPSWILLDKEKPEVIIQHFPSLAEVAPSVEISLVFEFYSR